MPPRPPRYGEDTWYGVVGYEGDPHILAYRREHPEHITVPLRWKNLPARENPPAHAAISPRSSPTRGRVGYAVTVQLPQPSDMLTVAELKAIMAEARAASMPARAQDNLLIPVQGGRGPRGPRPAGPPGARRDWTALELWNQHRIDNARARLAELEPANPLLQSLEPSGTPPTPRMADAMEAELIAARGRESRGEPGRGALPVVPERDPRQQAPDPAAPVPELPGTRLWWEIPPSALVGRRDLQFKIPDGLNAPAWIGGRYYTGHALDSMQGRGFTPSMVEDAIRHGPTSPGREGATMHFGHLIRVITGSDGRVVTVIGRSGNGR